MWDVVTLRPGKSPLRALAEAFGVAPDNAGAGRDRRLARREKRRAYRAGRRRDSSRASSTAASTPRRKSRTAC